MFNLSSTKMLRFSDNFSPDSHLEMVPWYVNTCEWLMRSMGKGLGSCTLWTGVSWLGQASIAPPPSSCTELLLWLPLHPGWVDLPHRPPFLEDFLSLLQEPGGGKPQQDSATPRFHICPITVALKLFGLRTPLHSLKIIDPQKLSFMWVVSICTIQIKNIVRNRN